jgi:hypothetical protein
VSRRSGRPFDSPLIVSPSKDEPLAQDRPFDSPLIVSPSKDEPLPQDRPFDSPLILSPSKDEPLAQDRPFDSPLIVSAPSKDRAARSGQAVFCGPWRSARRPPTHHYPRSSRRRGRRLSRPAAIRSAWAPKSAASTCWGYHAYSAAATWLVASPDGAPTPNAAAPDWQGFYAYSRWRPTFYASTSSDTSFFAGPATDLGTPTASTRRERQLQAGVLFPIRHTRAVHSALLSVVRAVNEDTLATGTLSRHRVPVRAAWQTLTGRTYGYSISREHGVAAGATAELVRRGLGSFADATTITGDARVYLPAFRPHHVVAVRVGGGASTGDPTVGRTFLLGGHETATDVADFDSDAFGLLRGFERNTFAGSHVAVANAEYRFPIARPQRGIGTWPVFLHSIHAAVFADAGHAWTRTVPRGIDQDVGRGAALRRHRRGLLRAVHRDSRRRVGPGWQRRRLGSRDGVFPDRAGVLRIGDWGLGTGVPSPESLFPSP